MPLDFGDPTTSVDVKRLMDKMEEHSIEARKDLDDSVDTKQKVRR